MIVDTSALVAVITEEEDGPSFAMAMDKADVLRLSAGTYLEASLVLNKRRDPVIGAKLDELIDMLGMVIEPVTVEQAKIARQAYRDYGRGSGHAANLNFGDCFSYALARAKREPILFKGDDFGHTDLRSAVEG
jgi:ribonuclease VapC